MPVTKGGKISHSKRHPACRRLALIQFKYMNSNKKRHITPGQCRAARGLLNISQRELAEAAEVSLSAIQDIETEARQPKPATLKAIQEAIETAGVELIPLIWGRRRGSAEDRAGSTDTAVRIATDSNADT